MRSFPPHALLLKHSALVQDMQITSRRQTPYNIPGQGTCTHVLAFCQICSNMLAPPARLCMHKTIHKNVAFTSVWLFRSWRESCQSAQSRWEHFPTGSSSMASSQPSQRMQLSTAVSLQPSAGRLRHSRSQVKDRPDRTRATALS